MNQPIVFTELENEVLHKEFEEWYSKTKYDKNAVWKPELNRYTVMSTKQFAWEIWNAAKGVPYVYNHGYSSSDKIEYNDGADDVLNSI